jgi:hypothetical protein
VSDQTRLDSDQRLIKSYVWHREQCYFVSTINRESSAALAYGARYAKTMVWLFDWEKSTRGELIHQAGDAENRVLAHLLICEKLHDKGIRGLIDEI